MSTPQPPSADQLTAARLSHWRQDVSASGEMPAPAVLTLESARRLLSSCGLLLFTPRFQHIASPAPTFVEATLGAPNATPSLAESADSRSLLVRLIAEGNAVPLNLLGLPSTTPEAPDFVVATSIFPYIFTLRGDKAWKQPPSTSGVTKVSPLALNIYTLLLEHGPTSSYDLATQLGREITEAAVIRSLNELWQTLRVLPVPQSDGGPTLWETAANRFTKQLKAGANAGQPSALSALISLYLSQALLATETEVETFLSPLASRSRVREVLHALTGARQLETIVVEGKTYLHIHGELPTFAAPERQSESAQQESSTDRSSGKDGAVDAGLELSDDGTRIKKFVPRPRKVGTGYVARAKPFASGDKASRQDRPFGRNTPPRDTSERGKPAARFADRSEPRSGRPTFNRPWDEERKPRRDRSASITAAGEVSEGSAAHLTAAPDRRREDTRRPKRPFSPSSQFSGERTGYAQRPASGGARSAYGRERVPDSTGSPSRRDFGERDGAGSRPPRRDFAGREGTGDSRSQRRSSGDFAKTSVGGRKPFRKPGFEDRKRDRSADPSVAGTERPPRREFPPRPDRPDLERRPFSRDRQNGGSGHGETRPPRPAYRKFDAPRRPFSPREGGEGRPPNRDATAPRRPSFGAKRAFTGPGVDAGSGGPSFPSKREGGSPGKRKNSFGPKPEGGFAGKGSKPFAGKKPFGAKSFGPKPGGSAGKRTFAGKSADRRGADAPGASTFDKFKGGNKPWGNRPPGRKPKQEEGEA